MILKFLKQHIGLLIACALPLVLAVVLALIADGLSTDGVSAIVMGALSYMGSITLGVFVYYHSWSIMERQKEENRPRLWVKDQMIYKGKLSLTPEKGLNNKGASNRWYFPVVIKNLTNHYYSDFSIEYVILKIDGQMFTMKDYWLILHPVNPTIAFGETMTYAFACDKRFVTNDLWKPSHCTYVISFIDECCKTYYLYHEMDVSTYTGVQKNEIYTETEFKEVRKHLDKTVKRCKVIQLT